MFLRFTAFFLAFTFCYCTQTIKKRTVTYKDGSFLEATESADPTTTKCYQYTWLGPQNRKTNITTTCTDLEVDDDTKERPCFAPLVWTRNDNEFSKNPPNPADIEAECKNVSPPCDPTCIPTGGQTCLKYTLMSDGKDGEIARITSFCGRMILDGDTIDKDTCKFEKEDGGYNVEVCSCQKKSKCNSAVGHSSFITLIHIVLLSAVLLMYTN